MSISVTEKKIKSKIKQGERIIIIENIKYPYFESEKHKKLCRKMNLFYSSVAERYSYHARNKLPKRIRFSKSQRKLPLTLSMNYTIALCDEKIVSVVLDLTFSEGKNIKCRRFSQMWNCDGEDILPVSEFIKTDRHSKKKIFSLVAAKAEENSENAAFGYFGDFNAKLSKKFDIRNCFAVPKGICFFFNAGILSPAKYGANNFILTYGMLKDVITGLNLYENEEKCGQNANNVNNV